ncbi:hypothetical protein Tco_0575456 [Tanacetum coccineum]
MFTTKFLGRSLVLDSLSQSFLRQDRTDPEFSDSYAVLTKHLYSVLNILILIRHTALPPREQRHPFLKYDGLQYTEADIEDFEMRLTRIYRSEADSARQIPDKGDLRDYWIGISSTRDFLGTNPSYTAIRDPILRLYHRLIAFSIVGRSQAPEKVTVTDLFYLRGIYIGSINVPYLLDRYLRLFAAGRKSEAHISGGQFIARLAKHFRLLTVKILQGLTVIAPKILIINMAELPDVAVSAPGVAQDAPIVDEGGQADPAPA